MRELSNSFLPIKVKDGLYAYIWQGMGNNCNTCLFTDVFSGPKPHLLIDPGHSNNGFSDCFQHLAKTMERDGFKVSEVGMIINTHSHSDHCQANTLLVKDNSVEIAMSEEEEQFRLTLGKRLDAMFGIEPAVFKTTQFLKEGPLQLGDKNALKLEIFITPGHSPGSACLYMPDDKILITGDVVFNCSVGRTDFPGGDVQALAHSIQRLSKLDVNCLIPGHSTEMGSIIDDKKSVQRNFQAVKSFFG
jgi:hydroxyacylglutathione hydrolase